MQESDQRSKTTSHLRVFITTTLVGCLCIAALNFIANPFNFYPTRVTPRFLFNDALTKVDRMKASRPPDVLVLGSSRVMTLSPSDIKQLTGLSAFNGGLFSATPVECCAALQYALRDCGWRPRLLIIGLDSPFIYTPEPPNESVLAAPEFAQYLPIAWRWRYFWTGADALLTIAQAKKSIAALHLAFRPAAAPAVEYPVDQDGLVHFNGLERQFPRGSRALDAQFDADAKIIKDLLDGLSAPGSASMERSIALRKLEDTVRIATKRNIKVLIFITPHPPKLLTWLRKNSNFEIFQRALLDDLKQLKRKYPSMEYEDLTEVSSFGGDPDGFYDWIHCRPENARLILARLLSSTPSPSHKQSHDALQ